MRAIEKLLSSVDMKAVRRSVTLPNGEEFEFWATPLTAAERERAMKEAGDNAQKFGLALLVSKAKDESGTPLFAPGDVAQLRRELPSSLVDELMVLILGKQEEDEEEEPQTDIKSRSTRAKA